MSDEVEMKRSKDMAEMESILTNPEKLASLKAENESLAEMNADQIREMGKSRIYSMTSPKVITSIGFLMLCVSSVGYTFLALLLSSALSVGVELRHKSELEHGELEHSALFLGPVLSYATEGWWATVTFLPQLTRVGGEGDGRLDLEEFEKMEARLLFGWHI